MARPEPNIYIKMLSTYLTELVINYWILIAFMICKLARGREKALESRVGVVTAS